MQDPTLPVVSRRGGAVPGRVGWAILNFCQFLTTLVWCAASISLALLVRIVTWSPRVPLWMARRMWAPFLLWGAGARVKVEIAPEVDLGNACLFAANHQSYIDIPTLYASIPVALRFVVKRELKVVPFLGWYVAAMDMVFIDRGSSHRAIASLRVAAEKLRSGHSVVCFPEGTRSRTGELRAFHNGPFAMAIEAGVPVVPVAIHGTGAVMPPDGFAFRPGLIRVQLGAPIATQGLAAGQRAELARRVQVEVERMLGAASPAPTDAPNR
jgi:1-acyl-sn-glycerol-3-phosphate acyltransferase